MCLLSCVYALTLECVCVWGRERERVLVSTFSVLKFIFSFPLCTATIGSNATSASIGISFFPLKIKKKWQKKETENNSHRNTMWNENVVKTALSTMLREHHAIADGHIVPDDWVLAERGCACVCVCVSEWVRTCNTPPPVCSQFIAKHKQELNEISNFLTHSSQHNRPRGTSEHIASFARRDRDIEEYRDKRERERRKGGGGEEVGNVQRVRWNHVPNRHGLRICFAIDRE